MKNNKIILAILLGIGVIILAAFFYRNNLKEPASIHQDTLVDTPTQKTYQNEKYGFKFSYPSHMKILEDTSTTNFTISVTNGTPEDTIIVTATPIDKFLPVGPDAVFYDSGNKEMDSYESVSRTKVTHTAKPTIRINNWFGFDIAGQLFIPNEKTKFIIGFSLDPKTNNPRVSKLVNSIELLP